VIGRASSDTAEEDGEADSLERALLRARGLLDVALRESRERESEVRAMVEYRPGVDALRAEVLHYLPRARREVLAAAPHAEWYWNSRDRLDHIRATLTAVLARGVTVRKIYTSDALPKLLALPGYREGLRRVGGPEVRVSETQLSELVIIDASIAFLRMTTAGGGDQCLVVRVPAILRSLHALYTAVWDSGVDMDVYLARRGSDLDETAARILRMLSEGHRDEIASSKLGLSVRTYRRRVAEIMRDLDANSRFQAGVRAVELGLT
jgi:DNA-binding CsgD family transcriptional regulator